MQKAMISAERAYFADFVESGRERRKDFVWYVGDGETLVDVLRIRVIQKEGNAR
jgi:hypothetical protein